MKEKYKKFANEYVVSLFPVFMLPIGIEQGTKKLLKFPVNIAFKIQGNVIDWYNFPDEWGQGHLKLVAKVKKDPTFLRTAYNQMVALANRQISYAKSLRSKISRASNAQLWKYYQKFVDYNIELYEYGLLLPLLDYQDTTFLSDELHKILRAKNGEQYFNLLTQPLRETIVKKQELDLLKLLITKSKSKKAFARQIRNHTKKYQMAYYVYEGPAADEKYFAELLQDLIKRKVNPNRELQRHRIFLKQVREKQKVVFQKLNFTRYEKQIVELARDAVFYKAYRRELQSSSYFFVEPLLAEIGRRLGLSLKQVRMLLPEEIRASLTRSADFLDHIQDRSKLLFYEYKSSRMILSSGEKAKRFIDKYVFPEKIYLKLKNFQGATAYPGRVKGKVKIVNSPDHLSKMEKGAVLVAVTTSPNLMPAIRMAKAIVTEEGGLTCHAAIISRELRIPCVVGAGGVAHALKDGDMVEVDANRGVIRRISK